MPVELWYLGDDDFPPKVRALFDRFDVAFVDAAEERLQNPVRRLGGWELKPFAIMHSRFAQVLWLDADNVPLVDPELLFDDDRFRRMGCAFWPDIRPVNPFNPIWSICNLDPPDGAEWETGQMLIDKQCCWPALQLTLHLNEWSDFYYRYVLGDKETFHLAWRMLDAPFAMPQTPPDLTFGSYTFGGQLVDKPSLWQHDFQGRTIFLHRTAAKWVVWGRNLYYEGFPYHDICLGALDVLRNSWDGYFTPPPQPSTLDIRSEEEIAGRDFYYIRRGIGSRCLSLEPDGRVGFGTQKEERFWRLEPVGDEVSLVLSSRTEDTCRFIPGSDGVWHGRWLGHEQNLAELIPLGGRQHASPSPEDRPPDRLLYVTPVMPAETGNGLAMRAANVLRLLCRSHRVSVLVAPLYSSGPVQRSPDWLKELCEDVRQVHPPSSHGGRIDDEETDQLWMSAWVEEAGRAYPDMTFDVIHVFRLAAVRFADSYFKRDADRPVRWHLDMDDVESDTQRQIAALYARYGRDADHDAAEQLASGLAHTEKEIMRTWDRVYVCSELDRKRLSERGLAERTEIVVLPNTIALPDNPPPVSWQAPLTLLYVGTLGYFPNADGLIWFCREILPIIREQAPCPFRVIIIGSGAPAEVQDLRHIPEVNIVGPVEDLGEWYRRADIVLVPLRAGGGTRIKILEAFAHRRPVVSTSRGAEGLDATGNHHLLIADRAQHFAKQCVRLMRDQQLAERLGDEGRALVEYAYDRDHVLDLVSDSRFQVR